MQTINQLVKLAKDFVGQENGAILNFHRLLQGVKKETLWKNKDFYQTQKTFDFKTYSKMSFHSFIKTVFGVTANKYENMNKILSLNKGKDLFLKYGLSNMNTYYHSTDEERKAILKEVTTKNLLSPWSQIKNKLYPPVKRGVIPTDMWKKKYEDLLKEYNAYKKSVEAIMAGLKKVDCCAIKNDAMVV